MNKEISKAKNKAERLVFNYSVGVIPTPPLVNEEVRITSVRKRKVDD